METIQEKQGLSRRELRRNDRRDAIVAVAYGYFLEHGYDGTSMSGIVATIGGSKATLRSYFPSKEALFEAVLDHATSMFRAQISTLLDPEGEPETVLRNFAHQFVERVTAPEAIALNRLVHAEVGRFPEIGEIFYQRGPRMMYGLVGDYIVSAMDRALLRRDDPHLAARIFIAMCMAGCQQQLLLSRIDMPTRPMIVADADTAVDLFMRAYTPG